MINNWICAVALVALMGLVGPIQADTYDDAPDFILHAKLSEMASPPSYNLYMQFTKTHLDPIDIWYRLKFDSANKIVLATPVYSTRNDSALIRSTAEIFSNMPFRPGPDTSKKEAGYLIRIGYRPWKGQCVYSAIPDPSTADTQQYDVLAELVHGDSVGVPVCFRRPDFEGETKVKYYVNEDGYVCSAFVLESSGWALFDLFALDVAEGWHYRPGINKGKPIGMWMNWTVAYSFAPPVGSE